MNSDVLKIIRNELCFHSLLPFQNKSAIILKEYYNKDGLNYENPNPAGGDDKNDGWVKERGIYYQMYSPTNYSSSFVKDVFEKFETDAKGLFENVYDKKLWKQPINEFIFIVNTRDQSIPKDSSNRCGKCIDELNKKYGASAIWKLVNVDYLTDLMLEIKDENIERNIIIKLGVDGLINYSNLDECIMFKFLDILSENIQENMFGEIGSNYTRISTERKININKLDLIKDKINMMIRKLNIVENAISTFEKQNPVNDVVERTKNFVIDSYVTLKDKYTGVDLYNKILEKILNITSELTSYKYAAELFMIYIFDKCDIFEKEDELDVFTK